MRQKVIRNARINREDKLETLVKYLRHIEDQDFTGYIKINFSQGSIGRIEKFEEILKNRNSEKDFK